MWLSVSGLFLYLFSSKNAIFHKFLYRTFWYSKNYTYFYFPKWRYKPRMVLKITNLHILRYLPTYWLYLLECYTIDNQWCTHTASGITGWRNPLGRHTGAWFSRRIFFWPVSMRRRSLRLLSPGTFPNSDGNTGAFFRAENYRREFCVPKTGGLNVEVFALRVNFSEGTCQVKRGLWSYVSE